MKAYVYFAIIATSALSACAYGDSGVKPFDDAGVIHADGGTKDAKAAPKEASTQEDASVDPPDVETTTCSSLPLATGDQTCDACLGSSCCAEDQTCGNDQDCMAFISCANNCFNQVDGGVDQTCEQTCESQYPSGVGELSNLDTCMQNSCGTACGL